MRKKQTKIVATISDLKCEPEFIRKLHDLGVDVVRLNTAHQSEKDTLKVIRNVRKVSERVALLLDTKGPEIRTCAMEESLAVKKGDLVKIYGIKPEGKAAAGGEICVNYEKFVRNVPIGKTVLIDDGELALEAVAKTAKYLTCKVLNDGVIKSNKSVNVPGVHMDLPSISKKDRSYIDFAIRHDLDFIAHSFVRSKEDVLDIQKILDKHKSKIKIIAKIENREGVDNIDEILDYTYGIMVARGDLGVEIPAEEIPLIQKKLVKKCIARQKPVIIATQMMHSMIKNPRPTRAEVSDVANAVLDGTDAIMLSGETAYGEYPAEAVHIMAKIIRQVELNTEASQYAPLQQDKNIVPGYLSKMAVRACQEMSIKEIAVCSDSGFSASVIASYRGRVPVYVKCFDKRTMREFALTYGVNAHFVKKQKDHKKFLKNLFSTLIKKGKLMAEDRVIYLAGDIEEENAANFMEICEVGKYVKK